LSKARRKYSKHMILYGKAREPLNWEAVVTAWQEANMTAEMSAQEPRPKSAKLFYETQRANLKNRIDKELPDGLEFVWTSDEFWWPAYDEVYNGQ